MPFHVAYLPDDNLVCVTNAGILSASDYQQCADEALAVMRTHDVWRCLIDNRELDNRVSVAELFKLPNYYAEIGIPRSLRAAILISDTTPNRADHEFFETVCVNNGYNFRLFADRDEALRWLMLR